MADRKIIGPHSVPFGFRTVRYLFSRMLDCVPMFGPDKCPGCKAGVQGFNYHEPRHSWRCNADKIIELAHFMIPDHWQDQNDGMPDYRYAPMPIVIQHNLHGIECTSIYR